MLVRIEAPHFVAGIEYRSRTFNVCPPILRYMKDWNLYEITTYCQSKNWRYKIYYE